MQHIWYNIRYRKNIPVEMFDIFSRHGIITGSTVLNIPDRTASEHDIDLAVLCTKELIQQLDACISMHSPNQATLQRIRDFTTDTKISDASQYVFDVLLSDEYCLYIKNNYRDSTFISCYVWHEGQLYNFLLMDEINVFAEWEFATNQLRLEKDNPMYFNKYQRIKFFEHSRKWFRRTFQLKK